MELECFNFSILPWLIPFYQMPKLQLHCSWNPATKKVTFFNGQQNVTFSQIYRMSFIHGTFTQKLN